MSVDPMSKDYLAGRSASKTGIKAGVPRWTCVGPGDPYKCIDEQTGLPIIVLAQQSAEIEAFAAGANDEILRAIDEGLITVDFRPLLLSREEIKRAFKDASVGLLSLDHPEINYPDVFNARLRSERVRKMYGVPHDPENRNVFIEVRNSQGTVFRDFGVYDRPVELALAMNNRVLLFRMDLVYLSYDLATSQMLNRYPC